MKREDGRIKLKPLAIPTIFNVPNPPKRIKSSRRVLKREQRGVDFGILYSIFLSILYSMYVAF